LGGGDGHAGEHICLHHLRLVRAARKWSVSQQNSGAAMRLLGPAARVCERRGAYDTQRAAAAAAIAKLHATPERAKHAVALEKQLADADALAAPTSLKIEAGVDALHATTSRAALWAGLTTTLQTHAKDRAAADKELAALDAHPAAAKIAAQRQAARKLLVDAATQAAAADMAPDPAAAWAVVLTAVTRVRTDLAEAKKLADGLGPALAAEAAALSAGDGGAAAALTKAKTIETDVAQFHSLLAKLQPQVQALKKSPRAALLKPRIDVIDTALADAIAKDKAHAGPPAQVSLRVAHGGRDRRRPGAGLGGPATGR
jgi:hypothetical protein